MSGAISAAIAAIAASAAAANGAFVQDPTPTIDDTGATSTTISKTLTGVAAGSLIVAHISFSSSGNISGVNDGSAYTADPTGKLTDTSNSQSSQVYFLPNAGAGSHTVTVTFDSAIPYRRLRLYEISGIAAASPLDKSTGQYQGGAGTAPNALSSGATATTANANCFVLGLTTNTGEGEPGSGTRSAGTGFTISPTADQIMTAEGKNVSATGAQTATFTMSVSTSQVTHVLAFKRA